MVVVKGIARADKRGRTDTLDWRTGNGDRGRERGERDDGKRKGKCKGKCANDKGFWQLRQGSPARHATAHSIGSHRCARKATMRLSKSEN